MAAQSPAIPPSLAAPSLLRPVVPGVSVAASRRQAEGAYPAASRAGAGRGFRRALGWLLDAGGMVALVYAIPLAIVVLPVVLLVRLVMSGLGLLARDGGSRHGDRQAKPPGS